MNAFTRRQVNFNNNEKMSYARLPVWTNGSWLPPLKYSIRTIDRNRYMNYDYSFCFSSSISGSCIDGSRG